MSEYKVEKSLSVDRLLVQDDKLTSDIWKTTKEEDRAYNLSLGDAIVEVALSQTRSLESSQQA